MRNALGLSVLFLLLTNAVFAGPFPPEWKNIQTVQLDKAGMVKMSLPAETIAASRPGLEDLRLFDDQGREVPFLLERPVQLPKSVRAPARFDVAMEAEKTIATLETGMVQPLAGVTLQSPARNFMKAVLLEGSGDGKTWEMIAQHQPVFRLADGASRLFLPFPPATCAFLRVTLNDHSSAPIPLTGALLHGAEPDPVPSEPLSIQIVGREEGSDQTRLILEAAHSQVTLAGLEIETSERLFTRPVSLAYRHYGDNEIRETVLAKETLYRIALEGQPATSKLGFGTDIVLPSRELILTIHNSDSPPLPVSSILAKRRPVFISWLAPGPGPFHLLSGNSLCPAPRYDIATLPKSVAAELITTVAPGPIKPNPAYRPAEPVAELQGSGSPIDLREWTYRKRVHLKQSGVHRLELDPETLSQAGHGLQDLRLIREGKQWPYLLDRFPVLRTLTPTVQQGDDPQRPSISRWVLKLPFGRLPLQRLSGETDAPFFTRSAVLIDHTQDERGNPRNIPIGYSTWVRTPGLKPKAMVIDLQQPPKGDTLVLEIENGDNLPLKIDRFQFHYPAARILFKASPEAETFLYYGNAKATYPRYDVVLIADRLLGVEKSDAALSSAESLRKPSWQDALPFRGSPGWLFWIVLGAVVLVLLLVIRRLLPKTETSTR
jgi:hypothetical protein